MKKFLLIASLLLVSLLVKADNVVVVIPGNTSSNLVSSPLTTDSITVTATTASTTTVSFFDSATTTTNYVQAAYVSYSTIATNWSNIFTNETGVLVTNTFSGIGTFPTAHSAATNSLPVKYIIITPGSAQRTKTVKITGIRGLTAVPNYDVIVEVDYHRNP